MQRDQRFHPKAVPPNNQGTDNYTHLPPAVDAFPPFYGVEFQPSDLCPKNFVIVDQTDHHSQVMFNPALSHRFPAPNVNGPSRFIHETFQKNDALTLEKELSFLKEDSDDIDALLSLDYEDDDDEGYDDDEVSTARTYGTRGSSSPDSCSNYGYKNSRSNACSSSTGSSSGEKKQLKMKRMVKALRGIVPGADQMSTVTVIDEAVRYLKSLKVEAEKLGVSDLNDSD